MRDERRSRRPAVWLLAVALLALAGLVTLRVGVEPEIEITSAMPGLGRATPVKVDLAAGGRGLANARVFLLQGEKRELLAEKDYSPRPPWAFWGARTVEDTLEVVAGRERVDWLEEGDATIRVESDVAPTWLRRPRPVLAEITLPVYLRPPALSVESSQHYPAQGGSEVVVYRVGTSAVKDGVQVGDRWFPGTSPSGGATRMALFAVPFDHEDETAIRLVAEDVVGNRAVVPFVDRFFRRPPKSDDIEVSERFMAKVVPEILANTPGLQDSGDLLTNYIRINNELRRRNAETLEQLAASSADSFLWSEPFQPMPGAQVMSAFADRRTYFHQGREIDRQDHLGFDLASVRRAPIPAANAGVVVLAEYFGIYGNTVVIDHGIGLMSLYGHLSSIEVEKGQNVEAGETIGRSGETGLAAGDHLHFTMLLRGVPVSPIEWWDKTWIRDRLKRKLGPALPFAG